MSFIQRIKQEDRICARCGRKADSIHHPEYRSEGGKDVPENREALCFYCHKQEHATKGDWQRWGRNGGKKTASNPYNLRNLRQFKNWSDERFNQWAQQRLAAAI